MATALYIAMILISLLLMTLVLLQARGQGLGSAFGGADTSVTRTRRGFEKILFQMTIVVAIVFFAVSLLTQFLL